MIKIQMSHFYISPVKITFILYTTFGKCYEKYLDIIYKRVIWEASYNILDKTTYLTECWEAKWYNHSTEPPSFT